MKSILAVFASLSLLPLPALADNHDPGAGGVTFDTWQVPWEKSRPRDPYVSPLNGNVWFVGQAGDYLGVFQVDKETFLRYGLPDGTGPHNVIIDDSSNAWIAGNKQGWIGRFDMESRKLKQFDMPKEIEDPHTLMFDHSNKDGLWFTAQWSNYLGYLNQETGAVQKWEMPVERSRPYGLVVTEDGNPWAALLGTNRLATIKDSRIPNNAKLDTVMLPRAETRPRRIGLTSDGRVWYVDYAEGYLGVYNPKTQKAKEWRSPSAGEARPYGMAVDDKDRVWYVETGPQPNRWIGFDTKTEEFISNVEIPDSGGAVRHMDFDPKTNTIWFGMDTNYLGRANLPD
ncbi:MAG: lyase [Gammaproteobacteria bacterium]|nr:lyase [Gammaproteobacteria bacterium]